MTGETNKVATETAVPTLTGELLTTPAAENALIVPEIGSQEIVSLNASLGRTSPKVSEARARELASKVNLNDRQSIITFGIEAQKNATAISEQLIQGVRTKDTGPVGDALNQMVREMKGLDFGALSTAQKPGLLAKILRTTSVLQKFMDKYKTVEGQIMATANILEGHRVEMLKGMVQMDKLYQATLGQLDALDEQVAAMDWLLNDVNTNRIPELSAKADASGDMADAQELRDMTERRDAIERRRHDLLLTRDNTIRALPSIRIVQSIEEGLAEKIQSQILGNVGMWKQILAVQIAAWKAAEAGKASNMSTDFTNDLIKQSADQLQISNRVGRKAMERGIYDVEAAEHAHTKLLETINESIDMAAEGKAKRADAEQRLEQAQENMRQGLIAAAKRQKELGL